MSVFLMFGVLRVLQQLGVGKFSALGHGRQIYSFQHQDPKSSGSQIKWNWDETKIKQSMYTDSWLVVSTHLKNISQIENLPQIGVNM